VARDSPCPHHALFIGSAPTDLVDHTTPQRIFGLSTTISAPWHQRDHLIRAAGRENPR
jgi:hypothetical protein